MTCPRCQQDNPSHAKFCLACGDPLGRTGESGPPGAPYAELQRALTEALEQQAATSEVLKLISRSAFDLQPVLETLLENAASICAAEWGVIFRPDHEGYRMAAVYGAPPEFKEFLTRTPIPPGRGSGVGRAALERRPVQVVDVSADPEYRVTEFQRIGGFRTVLAVPMLREGVLLGVFGLHRDEVRAFTEKQIQLVATFADQAAIAIENVRLFNETKEALEQQTATAEILRVISQSPTDVQPVFDAIASSAVRLCASTYGGVSRFDGTNIEQPIAMYNVTDAQMALYRRIFPLAASMETALGESVLTHRTVHVEDTLTERRYMSDSEAIRVARDVLGYRTLLAVPMVHLGQAVGIISVWRREQLPFSPKQIALVETFADQAVIAIENVRLFKELEARNRDLTEAHAKVSEALDQQTATSEVLRVISQSQTDVQPVFDTIVQSAVRLCDAVMGNLQQFDGERMHLFATHNIPPDALELARTHYPMPLDNSRAANRAVLNRAAVNIPDVFEDPNYESDAARIAGWRSVLSVPMLRDGESVGAITVARAATGG